MTPQGTFMILAPIVPSRETELRGADLITGDIVDFKPESPKRIVPSAEKGLPHDIRIEASDVQLGLLLLRLSAAPFSCAGVPVAKPYRRGDETQQCGEMSPTHHVGCFRPPPRRAKG